MFCWGGWRTGTWCLSWNSARREHADSRIFAGDRLDSLHLFLFLQNHTDHVHHHSKQIQPLRLLPHHRNQVWNRVKHRTISSKPPKNWFPYSIEISTIPKCMKGIWKKCKTDLLTFIVLSFQSSNFQFCQFSPLTFNFCQFKAPLQLSQCCR